LGGFQKDEKREDKEEKKQADIIKYVCPEDFQPPIAKQTVPISS
jgi:hypothetical protein